MALFQEGNKLAPGGAREGSGRPADPFRKAIAERTNNGQTLIDKAFQLLESKDEDIQLKALNWLGDRGWGKPAQAVTVDSPLMDVLDKMIVKYSGGSDIVDPGGKAE